ncbi:MAG: hypothetical protein HKN39_06315 [Flavobacteriales bacterium]|nr:hypothetical protein [Flavobacteriales bacterium]
MLRSWYLFFFSLCILLCSCAERSFISKAAKDQDIIVYGSVNDYSSGDPLDGTFKVQKNGEDLFQGEVSKGKYAHFLDLDQSYRIEFIKEGHISKYVTIDTHNVPLDDRKEAFSMVIDISLMRPIEGVDYSFFDHNAVGKASYVSNVGNMLWDIEYGRFAEKKMLEITTAHDKAAK